MGDSRVSWTKIFNYYIETLLFLIIATKDSDVIVLAMIWRVLA